MNIKKIEIDVSEFNAMFFLVMLTNKLVGLVEILQDQYMLGVTGPKGQ